MNGIVWITIEKLGRTKPAKASLVAPGPVAAEHSGTVPTDFVFELFIPRYDADALAAFLFLLNSVEIRFGSMDFALQQ